MRRYRYTIALFALLSMLFAQLAVAAYACPVANATPGDASSAMASMPDMAADMPGCHEMDQRASALCYAHCHHAAQSVEKAQLPLLAVTQSAALIFVVLAAPPAPAPIQVLPPQSQRITEPPLAIRNCCFRT